MKLDEMSDAERRELTEGCRRHGGASCWRCWSYEPLDYHPGTGVCRRYPPSGREWSIVGADDWCQKFVGIREDRVPDLLALARGEG